MYMKKNKEASIVGGMTLVGLGIGFVLLETSPLLFLGSLLAGLGLGLVFSSLGK